jgi:uncharacterized protein
MSGFGRRTRDGNQATGGAVRRSVVNVPGGAAYAAAGARAPAASGTASYDESLRTYMLGVYNMMALGVAFSGAITMYLISRPDLLEAMMREPLFPVIICGGTFGLSFLSGAIIASGSAVLGHIFFWTYCALWGAGLAPCINYFIELGQPEVVARSFFIAASMFAMASLYGYTTRDSLAGFGGILCMLAWGLFIASILNFVVFKTDGFGLIISYAVVIVFTAITAWETQEIKDSHREAVTSGQTDTFTIFGAFQLYGSFMMIFSRLLNILAQFQGEGE